MTERATCWSITINNPTEEDVRCDVPGWKLSGQYEQGEEGTRHFQGMLKTPQVRFSAIKKAFPRAHIEVARDPRALAAYVNKEETRVAAYAATGVPTIFEYQRIIANEWDNAEWERRRSSDLWLKRVGFDAGNLALQYVDEICSRKIEEGAVGLEFIAINPIWRSSWKKFYSSIITRNARPSPTPSSPQAEPQAPAQGSEPDFRSIVED